MCRRFAIAFVASALAAPQPVREKHHQHKKQHALTAGTSAPANGLLVHIARAAGESILTDLLDRGLLAQPFEYHMTPAQFSVLAGKKVVITPNIGFGFNFFLNQTMALKLDARSYFYIANEPQYNPNEPVETKRLYNNLVASVGLSFFIPEMKKRMYNF